MANAAVMAALAKISGAQVNKSGNFIKPGTYRFAVQAILLDQKRKGMTFIAELKVVESQDTGLDLEGNDVKANKVGEVVAEIQNLDGPGADSAPGNIKAFVCGLLGVDPNTVDAATVQSALAGYEVDGPDGKKVQVPGLLDKSQPAKGMLIDCVAFTKPTRAGKPFTVKNWSPVEQTADEVRAQRAGIDADAANQAA